MKAEAVAEGSMLYGECGLVGGSVVGIRGGVDSSMELLHRGCGMSKGLIWVQANPWCFQNR